MATNRRPDSSVPAPEGSSRAEELGGGESPAERSRKSPRARRLAGCSSGRALWLAAGLTLVSAALLAVCGLVCSRARAGASSAPRSPHPLSPSWDDFSPEARAWIARYPGYGYNGTIYRLREEEFPQLKSGERPSVYLDFTGSGLPQRRQLEESTEQLESALYCNIHSDSRCSRETERAVEEVRDHILDFFHVPRGTYTVIFTSGATGALHLIGESFPWSEDSKYLYSKQNHNSVLGVRMLAKEHGAEFRTLPWDLYKRDLSGVFDEAAAAGAAEEESDEARAQRLRPNARSLAYSFDDMENGTHHLVAFPAECNFGGVKYPLDLVHAFQTHNFGEQFAEVDQAKENHWHVLLDAAAFVPTNPLDLNKYPASFVVMSFYKMFGWPTGLGALLVRNDVAPILRKHWFAGGSVVMVSCDSDFCKLKPQYHERFEDGTMHFLGITALKHGFTVLEELGMDSIQQHVWAVTRRLYEGLSALRHSTGTPVVKVYGEHERNDPSLQGGIVAFNLLTPDGSYIGYSGIGKLAADEGFMIRAGCSCNPGSCHNYLGLSEDLVISSSMQRTSCGDEMDNVDGIPLGAVRVSMGYITTLEDVDAFVDFVRRHFVE